MGESGEKERDTIQPDFDRSIMIDFQGAKITSDTVFLLLREIEERFGILGPIEIELEDARSWVHLGHTQLQMIRQRVYQIAAGYEDFNDADLLRIDAALRLAMGPVQDNRGYQAKTWDRERRVVAKIEWHDGEVFPRIGFIVTNSKLSGGKVVKVYNGRCAGTRRVAVASPPTEPGYLWESWPTISCTCSRNSTSWAKSETVHEMADQALNQGRSQGSVSWSEAASSCGFGLLLVPILPICFRVRATDTY
jgi:hypothetical protein